MLQAACIQKYRQMICAWHVPRHFFLCPWDRQCSPIPKCPLSTSMCKHCRSRGHTRAALHATNNHLHVSLNPDSLHNEGDPGHLEIGEHCRSHGHTGAYMQQKNTGGEHVSLNARSWQIEGGTGHLGGSENIAAPRHTCRTTCSSILTTCVSESKQLANRRAHWWTGRIADPLVDSTGRPAHTLCGRQCWPPCKRTCTSEMYPSRFDWRLVGVRRGGPHPTRRTIFANDPCEIQPTKSVSSSAS